MPAASMRWRIWSSWPSVGPLNLGPVHQRGPDLSRPVLVSSHVGLRADLVIPGRYWWIVPAGDGARLARRPG